MDVMAQEEGWVIKADIAERSGQCVSSFFSDLLANLTDRGYLESGHRGYRRPPGTQPALPPKPRDRDLSALEDCILAAASSTWQSGADLALKVGQKCNRDFYDVLRALVDRGRLEMGCNGYRRAGEAKFEPATEDEAHWQRVILGILTATKQGFSLGELLGMHAVEHESDIKVAVQQLVQAGRLKKDRGVYSLPEE
jgi:hypothetical protein